MHACNVVFVHDCEYSFKVTNFSVVGGLLLFATSAVQALNYLSTCWGLLHMTWLTRGRRTLRQHQETCHDNCGNQWTKIQSHLFVSHAYKLDGTVSHTSVDDIMYPQHCRPPVGAYSQINKTAVDLQCSLSRTCTFGDTAAIVRAKNMYCRPA